MNPWVIAAFFGLLGAYGAVRIWHRDPPLRSWRGVVAGVCVGFFLGMAAEIVWTLISAP